MRFVDGPNAHHEFKMVDGRRLKKVEKSPYLINTLTDGHHATIPLLPNKTANFIKTKLELECGPMPNVMAALPNIGGAQCSTPQSLADAHY